ncbi:ABC transporter substrate-binding protein [Dethiothermospora halolimnae]|uniref:ABC transporter substrate-binding protein n=1 Tax=Dethiothermospora halolimnae TaxID=3114390 RepID=UPI003CCC0DF6
MKLKRVIYFLLMSILSISISACGINGDINNDTSEQSNKEKNKEYEPTYGGEIVVPVIDVETLNPLLNKSKSQYYFNKLVFEGLFSYDEDLSIKKQLVENYSIRENGRIISLELKENVKWHDGEILTSEDVEFTINTLKYANNDLAYKNMLLSTYNVSTNKEFNNIIKTRIRDNHNIDIIFDKAYGNVLESLIFPIIPKHEFIGGGRNISDSYVRALSKNNYTPIGTGPFKFDKYNKLKEIKLVANENWWGKKPYINKVTGKILDSSNLAITSFEAGQIDLTTTIGSDWEKYAQNEKVKIYEFPSTNYEFLAFNFKNEKFNSNKGNALRKAISYGIDRESIIQKVYLGHGMKSNIPLPPKSWLRSSELNKYNYNKEKAKTILEEAGWTYNSDTGVYINEARKELVIKLLTNPYSETKRNIAELITENLSEIGIKVIKDYQINLPENITEELLNKKWGEVRSKIVGGDYEVALLEWELSNIPDLKFAFHSSQIGASNFIFYNNKKMDQLLLEANRVVNKQSKKNIYLEIQELLTEDLPYVGLHFKNSALLINDRLRGNINPQDYNIYNNIEEWFIPEPFRKNKIDKEEVK